MAINASKLNHYADIDTYTWPKIYNVKRID